MSFLDRLANVLRGAVTDDQSSSRRAWDRARSNGDPDLDEAWDDLNDFLNEGREGPDTDGSGARQRRTSSASEGATSAQDPRQQDPLISPKTERAYTTIRVPVGAPLAEVRAAYKKLMRQHHPDRFADDAEKAREATLKAARINTAYEHILSQSQRRSS